RDLRPRDHPAHQHPGGGRLRPRGRHPQADHHHRTRAAVRHRPGVPPAGEEPVRCRGDPPQLPPHQPPLGGRAPALPAGAAGGGSGPPRRPGRPGGRKGPPSPGGPGRHPARDGRARGSAAGRPHEGGGGAGEERQTGARARGWVKRYGPVEAAAGIDFTIRPRECYGFLGPNGAGKTTTIRMVTCRIPRTAGELEVLGRDVDEAPAAIKAQMGVVSQENNLDESLTVLENLYVYGRYHGLSHQEALRRSHELLELMQLEGKARVRPMHLSGGMKRRLAIARALVNRPRLVVLDEPTTGLDPQARLLVWQR